METQIQTKSATQKATETLREREGKPDVSAVSRYCAVSSDLLQNMKVCLEMLPAVWDSFAYCTLHVTEHKTTRLIGQE